MELRQILGLIGSICIGSILSELIYQKLRKSCQGNSQNSPHSGSGTLKTLFFPDEDVACKNHFTLRNGCTSQRCRFSHDPKNSYGQLLKLMSSARVSLEVCVFTITCTDLADVLIDLHHKGVIIKVITDGENQNASGSKIQYFREKGIQVRTDKSSYFMHHKFVIVDGQILLNGSFNWTRQAVTGNHENLLVTTCPELLLSYKQEFDKLWLKFDSKGSVNRN